MAAAGATIHRETVGKAAMGWRGALRAGEIYGVLRWTRRHFDAHPPDLQIGVDSPSMNFHFARAAKERGVVFVKGTDFLLEGGQNTLRLAYSGVTPDEIAEGIARLADAVRSVGVTA